MTRRPIPRPEQPISGPPVLRTSWSGPQARQPAVVRDDLTSECLRELAYEFAWFGAVAGLLAAGLFLGGCATTQVQCASLERGECTVSSTRFLTDSAVNLRTPDGTILGFTSEPNQAGVSAAFGALGEVIKYLAPLAARAPGAGQVNPTPDNPDALRAVPQASRAVPQPSRSPLQALIERRTALVPLESAE